MVFIDAILITIIIQVFFTNNNKKNNSFCKPTSDIVLLLKNLNYHYTNKTMKLLLCKKTNEIIIMQTKQ